MKPEQQRIAIAKACGWKWNAECDFAGRAFPECWTHDDYPMAFLPCDLPDYLNDLNAMHEAEKVLTPEQCDSYQHLLGMTVNRPWHATATQRAEVFLQTLNLWTP